MGKKFLVVVGDQYLRDGEAAQASAAPIFGVAPTSDPLGFRRQALARVAEALVGHAAAESSATVAALGSPAAAGGVAMAVAAPAGVTILPGIGALIVDEDVVDPASLSKNTVLEVYPNTDIDLILPVAGSTAVVSPWHRPRMGLPQPETGRGALVGILDTGIDTSHQEFIGKTIHFQEFDAVGTPLAGAARDAGTHGTHVCGIVAGSTCGIAPEAELAVAAVLTAKQPDGRMSGTLLQIAAGLNWLLATTFRAGQTGVDVINASLGSGVSTGGAARSGYHSFLHSTLRTALLAPGVMMIASIGNDGMRGEGYHGSPGNYDVTLSVGATNNGAPPKVAGFSDWDTAWHQPPMAAATKPDVCAPGVDIYSSVPPAMSYATMSGTSMAAPMVAGAAAVLLERMPALRGNPSALRAALMGLATLSVNPPARGGTGQVTL